MNSDDFSEDIALKLYLKYKYHAVLRGPRIEEEKSLIMAINDSFNHL